MTALKDYDRLESPGIWRPSPDAQRIDVIVSVGDATLMIADQQGNALTHWSLPAVERINPGERPALFRPGPDAPDILELSDDLMIRANKTVQSAIERRRPHPGRLRFVVRLVVATLIVALIFLWLPRAMINYTASIVPAIKRQEIGHDLLTSIRRVSGKTCDQPLGMQALGRLKTRLFGSSPGEITVLFGGIQTAEHLPGHIILLNRALVEDFEDPAATAGFVLAEKLRAEDHDPLVRLLNSAGIMTVFKLLTTGSIPAKALAQYAETLVTTQPEPIPTARLLQGFEKLDISAKPYAYAIDISGETTLPLIEADPVSISNSQPVLEDSDWVSLQEICGE